MVLQSLRRLIPRKDHRRQSKPLRTVLNEITAIQWAHFLSGLLAWTCDSVDFFSVSVSVTNLQTQFNRSTHDITTAITLTLLFRSAGAALFGMLSDRYGRKWPLVFNLIIVSILELGAGFTQTFHQFLAVRSLFGIGMGGVWGLATATALENLPVEARGIASGILQEGYAIGYLIAAVINLWLVPEVGAGWRSLFWTASGISLFAAFVRILLPESEVFLRAKNSENSKGKTASTKTKIFIRESQLMLKNHWMLCIYAVVLMTGFNFLSHGTQDLYPTYLSATKGFTSHSATVATIIGNCGAIAGGVFGGWLSQHIGRRLTMIIHVFVIAAFIPLWILPSTFGPLAAGAFFLQFGVQGAWGVIPIHLAEMSPPAFRATFPGLAYQLGNMASSASAQIEATGGEHLRTTIIQKGKVVNVPDYASVQGIFIGAVAAFVILMILVGPEHLGSQFEKHKMAFEEGHEESDIIDGDPQVATLKRDNSQKGSDIDEKNSEEQV